MIIINIRGTAYKEIDVLPWLSRSALDGVCQAILGYPSNTLDVMENDEYTEALRMIGYVVAVAAIVSLHNNCASPLISRLVYFRPLVPMVVRNFSPYWTRKLVNFITAPWIPTEKMREVRQMRRIVEIMDTGSKKAFEEKKAHQEILNTSSSTDVEPGAGGLKAGRRKDMMDIMRQLHNRRVFLQLKYL